MLVFRLLKKATLFIAETWQPGKRGSQLPSTWPLTAGMIPIIPGWSEMSVKQELRLIRFWI